MENLLFGKKQLRARFATRCSRVRLGRSVAQLAIHHQHHICELSITQKKDKKRKTKEDTVRKQRRSHASMETFVRE